MAQTRKFEISVLGETIRINSDENVDYMNEVIEHVNNTVDKVDASDRSGMSTASKMLFSIVLLTDELLKTRAEAENMVERLKLSDLELSKAQKELSDFINVFEGEAGSANV